MGEMWRATVKGVLARRVRLALTALAVVLGVTFVSGTYVLTDTLKQSLGTLFSQYAAGAISSFAAGRPSATGAEAANAFPRGSSTPCARFQGSQAADGFLQGYAKFVEKDGKTTIQTAGRADVRDLVERRRPGRAGADRGGSTSGA